MFTWVTILPFSIVFHNFPGPSEFKHIGKGKGKEVQP